MLHQHTLGKVSVPVPVPVLVAVPGGGVGWGVTSSGGTHTTQHKHACNSTVQYSKRLLPRNNVLETNMMTISLLVCPVLSCPSGDASSLRARDCRLLLLSSLPFLFSLICLFTVILLFYFILICFILLYLTLLYVTSGTLSLSF